MSTQSYPWLKVGHEQYRNSEFRAKASVIARCAYLELVMVSAQQSPIYSIPNDDAVLAGWSGIAINQWLKVRDVVLSQFTQGDDGRFYCPMLIDLYKDNQQSIVEQDNELSQEDISAKRSAAANARWAAKRANAMQNDDANNANDDFASCKTDAKPMQNDNLHDAKHMQNNANGNFAYANTMQMGGRGEDLDSELNKELDLKQELKTTLSKNASDKKITSSKRFFDDEFRPDLNALNAKLGADLIKQKFIDENLFSFNSHYETQQLTDNQRLAKWIAWWRSEEAKKQTQAIKRQPKDKVFGNVNDDFPIVNHRLLTPEEIAANKEKLNDLPF